MTTLLSPKPLETIRQLWTLFSFVCQLRDEQRERLGVSGHFLGGQASTGSNPTSRSAQRLQLCLSYHCRAHRLGRLALRLASYMAKSTSARHHVECADDPGLRNPTCKVLRARRGVGDNEFGIVSIQRKRAGDNHLVRKVACLFQYFVNSQPVQGQQERVCSVCGLSRCARLRVAPGIPREPLHFFGCARSRSPDARHAQRASRACRPSAPSPECQLACSLPVTGI